MLSDVCIQNKGGIVVAAYYQFLSGDDAPVIRRIKIRGKAASYSSIAENEAWKDDDVEIAISATVDFASYPDVECLFSQRLVSAIGVLGDYGRLVRIRVVGAGSMYAFFPYPMDLFDEAGMGAVHSNAIKGAVVGFKTVAFRGAAPAVGRSKAKGVLAGDFFCQSIVEKAAASRFGVGYYFKIWAEGESRPSYVRADLGGFASGDERTKMPKLQ